MNEQEKLQAQIALLLPVQQQTIAMAQLAGCEFKPMKGTRHIGYAAGKTRWVDTTSYTATLPDGLFLGLFEDVYEAAVACIVELNRANEPERTEPSIGGLFRLSPENEQP